jgi:hypothetical protein
MRTFVQATDHRIEYIKRLVAKTVPIFKVPGAASHMSPKPSRGANSRILGTTASGSPASGVPKYSIKIL